MIGAFAAFVFVMNKNSESLKKKNMEKSNSEIGIVSLQGENTYKKFNTETKIEELRLTGQDVNVLLFDNSDINKIYDEAASEAIHNQLWRMIEKKEYDFDNPLIAYNPYGINTCSIYMYFETRSDCLLRYSVTSADDTIPDFTRIMNDLNGRGYSQHEYILTGLIPGKENYIYLQLETEDGAYIDSKVYKIILPESGYGNPNVITADIGRKPENMTEGLFFVYGTNNGSVPVYDNSGYLRGEIPLINDTGVPVQISSAYMLVACSDNMLARVSRTGQVVNVYPLGNYRISGDMVYNGRGQVLAVASESGRDSLNDVIICLDIESGTVKASADMTKKIRKIYKKAKKNGVSDWIGIDSIEFINNNDLLVNASKLSSVIKLTDIMSANPTVSYIIGNRDMYDVKGLRDLLLSKSSGEESAGTDEDNNEEALIEDPFEDMNGNKTIVYEEIKESKGSGEDERTGYYYINVLNINNGSKTSCNRYLVNEDEKTYRLVSSVNVPDNSGNGSLNINKDNYVVYNSDNMILGEYSKEGKLISSYSVKADKVEKNTLKGFWFR